MRVITLGRRPFPEVEAAMRDYTAARAADSDDQIWLVEHDPVYTLGVAGRDVHLLAPAGIPVQRTDRGGQVTYHGPGQVVAYALFDLRRLQLYVKAYVYRLEEALVDTLWHFGIVGHRVAGAPGIYVRLADPGAHAVLVPDAADPFAGLGKIAAIGLKLHQQRSYHGVALNVAMDLEPFGRIDPCGYAGLRTVDLRTVGVEVECSSVAAHLAQRIALRVAG